MELGIKGKKVLVTGASRGLGRVIAMQFAQEGCKVSVIARDEEALKRLVADMGSEKEGHSYFAIDLMKKGAPTEAVNHLIAKNGAYDIIVHNLGGTLEIRDVLSSAEDWNKVWYFNVGIPIEMNQLLVPYMKIKGWGRIIHVSSITAEALRGCGPYGAAKAYLNAYTKILGRGLSKENIIVSAILPGAIYTEGGHWDEKTEKNKNNIEEFLRKKSDFLRHHQAIGRFGKSEEIAPFVLFMASEKATFAAGSLIPVEGGTM